LCWLPEISTDQKHFFCWIPWYFWIQQSDNFPCQQIRNLWNAKILF
jgi:hypothetical protein